MAFSVRLLTKLDQIEAVRPQWDRLWERSDHASYGLTSAACMAVFKHVLAARGTKLLVVVGHEDGELVALWPLATGWRGPWRVVNQAGPLAAEYSNVLVERGPQAAARVAEIWRAVERARVADIAVVPFVREGPLGSFLAAHRHVTSRDTDIAPRVAWRGDESWDAYYASLDGGYRRGQNRRRRQLAEQGAVAFEVVTDPARAAQMIAWLLAEKRHWADRVDKRGAWVFSPAYEAFLASLVTGDANAATRFVVFVLTLDGAQVAAKFAMVGPCQLEFVISGFLGSLGRFSPGNILNEHCLRYAHERGLAVEFGAGREETKKYWSRGTADVTTNYRLALTRWGAAAGVAQRWVGQVQAFRRTRRRVADGLAVVPVTADGGA